MYGVDRLKVVMPLECVEIVDKSVFICKVQGKQLLNMMYKRMIPSLLDIKLDYENFEAVIEFTGKILGSRYPELIRLTNIKQCIDNINALGIISIDRNEISHAKVVKCDLTTDTETSDVYDLNKYIKNSISNYDTYVVKFKKNGNLIIEKNVDTNKCKRRLTIYNKEKEMNMASNKMFLSEYFNGQNPFIGKCRFEMNLKTAESIRQVLNIESPTVWNVLVSARVKNPIRDFLSDVLVETENVRCTPNLKAYWYDLTLADNDNDMQKVYNKLKSLCAKGTKINRTIKPIRERLETRDYTMRLFTRDKVLDMITRETRISSFDVAGYPSL